MVNPALRKAPAVFVNHGAGPFPILKPIDDPRHGSTRAFLERVAPKWLGLDDPATKPAAIVLVTAHWEESVVSISSGESHELYYDYYGFPDEAYSLTYKAKGSPAIAHQIHALLAATNIPSKLDPSRGWDHGVFVPMKLIHPAEDIPIVQVSVVAGLDPDLHLRIGQALASLRDENIAIVGSGATFHPSHRTDDSETKAKLFNDALVEASSKPTAVDRHEALKAWAALPHARDCHQREEHLIPLHVIAGAGGDGPATSYDITGNGMFRSVGWGVVHE
ncbi:hypothetical protein DYB37_000326 [Aphanomyces astaci]|uniref:Extradiol ring-cleavage dioxygenase class III enzyme subunit B domain-containing protein n=1 Tax=Aphanomyces astaci TaxID=112090 RepID=A0A3R6WP49_APHAT|nr:hypothetical protein DYB35_007076 [Aphanomyces astaci]RHZ23831.1 hypothetical protein DYB37_000326 [Aphanomyces astaci]